jgi:hypothetical protein
MARVFNRFHKPHSSRPGKQPLARDTPRASEAAIASQTGGSGPISGSHTKHVVHSKIGDHRQGIHTGSANSSKTPRGQAGTPQHPSFNRGSDGNDAA